jgi:hypothetical protein
LLSLSQGVVRRDSRLFIAIPPPRDKHITSSRKKQHCALGDFNNFISSLPMDSNYIETNTDALLKICRSDIKQYLHSIKEKSMSLDNLIKIKAELLCYGVRINEVALVNNIYNNSYLLDGGFVHAAHFIIEGIIVNTCVVEDFCKKSPYEITWIKNNSILTKDGLYVCDIEILPTPSWCSEYVSTIKIGDYLRPHSHNCISCCPRLKCVYREDEQCKFCSLNAYAAKNNLISLLDVDIVVEMIKRAIAENPNYEIALSGGTCCGKDKSATYFTNICRKLTENKTIHYDISVELAPPDNNSYIEELYKAGATSIIMNIEIADEERRIIICPGKSNIPLNRYFSALGKAVEVFGRGNVSTVLISSLQPENDIKSICNKLIQMRIVPTIIPFKPLDSCSLKDHPIADPVELIRISKYVNKLLLENNLFPSNQVGCTKCGGCSLETVFQLKNHHLLRGEY